MNDKQKKEKNIKNLVKNNNLQSTTTDVNMSSEIPKTTFQLACKRLSFQKNYFLQCNATAAGSSQSNVSRAYILKKTIN